MQIVFLVLVLAGLLYFSYRYAWWASTVDYRHPRILMYHMIAKNGRGQKQRGLRVKPEVFEQQLAWLKSQGWTFMSMAERISAGESCPAKTVVLTFDDGYEDNYLAAFPLLKKYEAKATLYLVCDRHGRDWSVYKKAHHDTGELAAVPKLKDVQVREMLDSGLVELGAHTITHANLIKADATTRTHEIAGSRSALQSRFGGDVTSFAYPFGIYTHADIEAVRDAGFTNAVTTNAGIDENLEAPMELKRVKISGKEGLFAFKLRVRIGRKGMFK